MTETRILKSRMKLKFQVRFGSGGGVGDCPADHNCAIRSLETVSSDTGDERLGSLYLNN